MSQPDVGDVVVAKTYQGQRQGLGRIRSALDRPSFKIERPDGSTFQWAAEITEKASPVEELEFWRARALLAEERVDDLEEQRIEGEVLEAEFPGPLFRVTVEDVDGAAAKIAERLTHLIEKEARVVVEAGVGGRLLFAVNQAKAFADQFLSRRPPILPEEGKRIEGEAVRVSDEMGAVRDEVAAALEGDGSGPKFVTKGEGDDDPLDSFERSLVNRIRDALACHDPNFTAEALAALDLIVGALREERRRSE